MRVEIKASSDRQNFKNLILVHPFSEATHDLFHQVRGNQERSHEMQGTGDSIQRPKEVPKRKVKEDDLGQ